MPKPFKIDGGVKVDNICADTFVAESAIFSTDDCKATINAMRAKLALAK